MIQKITKYIENKSSKIIFNTEKNRINVFQTAGKHLVDIDLSNGETIRNVIVFQFAGLILDTESNKELHEKLIKQGYYAVFVQSFDEAKKIIDDYFQL